MGKEELSEFLENLPEREFESGEEFERVAIPEFVDALGYDENNLFFGHVYSESGNIKLTVDALVGRNRIKRPWMLIEAKYLRSKRLRGEDLDILERIEEEGNPQFSVLLSNQKVVIRTNRSETHQFDLSEINDSDVDSIYDWLHPPKNLPEEDSFEGELYEGYEETHVRGQYFELDLGEYRDQLKQMKAAEDKNLKGDALEELAAILFESTTCLEVRERNLTNASSEIDLVVEYNGSEDYTLFDEYGRYILVECKNWESSVGAKQVRDFVKKLQNTHTDIGIIFAKNGISGSDKGANALREIDLAHKQEEVSVLVLDIHDLENIANRTDFYEILDEKLYELRFSL